ncbi:hypothetical protein U9M48_002300 [Paspalum notatum var. saurae]|uniref:Reverse transcriptase zinc-binding domain-containing protein n=1 Tax=Paspalum notatum var. saurae TaxID=547442 RepID=A0AAQ3PR28_PASNO
MLAVIMSRAKKNGKVQGVIPHLVEGGLSILQYADDKPSGLKINFHKSEIFCFGHAKEHATLYADSFGCKLGSYLFRYLGLPMHVKKLRNKDWKLIEDRIEKRLGNWKGKLLSYGGRLVRLNSVLSSLPMFMLSFFEIPRGVLKKIEYFSMIVTKEKYRLIKCPLIYHPKTKEVWLFKLFNEDGLWQELLRNKYMKDKPLAEVEKKPRDSHFWKGLMGVKDQFINLGRKKHATVANVLSSSPLNIFFRIGLVGNKLLEWHNLITNLIHALISNGTNMSQEIWRLKIPLKIKIFLWFLKKGVLLTKDNLVRRNWRVLFRETHWLRFLAQLQRTDDMKDDIVRTCRSLKASAMELFASHGWPFMFRIGC